MSKPDKTLDHFWNMPLRDLLELLEGTPGGLSSAEAKQRLRVHGPNSLVAGVSLRRSVQFSPLFCESPRPHSPAGQHISIALGDPVGGSIIIAIVLLSVV